MKIKTSELQEEALDWAVAKCEGRDRFFSLNLPKHKEHCFSRMAYSTRWALAGPIIERERIWLHPEIGKEGTAGAWYAVSMQNTDAYGPTPLIAAMRCYVASQLGGEVELPEELIEVKTCS